jgi:hypothetical protein
MIGPLIGGTVAFLGGLTYLTVGEDGPAFWGTACLLLGGALIWVHARLKLVVSSDGLSVTNYLSPTQGFRWSEVSAIEFDRDPRGDTWLVVRDGENRCLPLRPTQGLSKGQRRRLLSLLTEHLGGRVNPEVGPGWLERDRSTPTSKA